jgi:hypothetical protein
MLQTMLAPARPSSSVLRIGVGVAEGTDALDAVVAAATAARTDLDGAPPHLAIVVATSTPRGDVSRAVRGVLGPAGIVGGVTSGLLTDQHVITQGALVLCFSNAEGAVSGVAATGGRRLADSAQAAARLVLAGWPFRGRYPRGVAMAFTAHGAGAPAAGFLTPWRELMGPKMRTICGAMTTSELFGASTAVPLASVGCLEAPYLMGLGLADGGGDAADAASLIHGSVEATRSALKWLEARPTRVALVLESRARLRKLGSAASREWAAIREEIRQHNGHAGAPCVGWLCDEVAAYGRGVHPIDVQGAMSVMALGDPAREGERLG